MLTDDVSERLASLENKVHELEAMVTLALRLLSVERSVTALLERYGATQKECVAVLALLDDLATRAERGGRDAPSVGGFEWELFARFPAVRGDRSFVSELIDSLRLDRPAYRKLHEYATANWPDRSK
jgi:hypothetical protein